MYTIIAAALRAFVWTITLENQNMDHNKITNSDQVKNYAFHKNTYKIVMINKLAHFYYAVNSYSSLPKEQKNVSSVGI